MNASVERDMQSAYDAGEHVKARALAERLRAQGVASDAVKRVLGGTEADWFLTVTGIVGLGLTAFLVYKYVL